MNHYQKYKDYYSNYHRDNYHKQKDKLGLKNKREGEYCIRVLDGKQHRIFGLTIPAKIVKKYNLEGSIFKIRISPKGKFILYSNLNKTYK